MSHSSDPNLRGTRAWPFEEAAKVADRLAASGKGSALFETGYGPSGLPHIGTFGEVARTTWVRRAFEAMTGLPSRLLAFSDDMDGLRKVPDNVPNGEMLRQYLGRPLTRIPDPFGTHDSFGAHNNARLRTFLDSFGFEYEFASSTDYYTSGRFDAALIRMAEEHEAVLRVILPTLGPDRRATYSPFLPIHPETGVVMQVPMEEVRPADRTLVWRDPETGERFETLLTGGHCKAQWKADWALRWYALGVDYEMSGKDLIDSVKLSSQICRVLGAEPPVGFTYELFLDAGGQKISKSKGNGLTIEEWLEYGPPESLSLFMYNSPKSAKRLHFDVIPRATDDYLAHLDKLRANADPANPAWHVQGGKVPNMGGSPIPFSMLLNLAVVANAETPEMLWGFVRRYQPEATPESEPMLARLVEHALAYYRDFVKPAKRYRAATPGEREALEVLAELLRENRARLEAIPAAERGAAIQDLVYDAGRREPFLQTGKDGRPGVSIAWFEALYQVLLGQQKGPRFGGFVALYGIPETIALIGEALSRPAPDTAEGEKAGA
ncbi:Class 1 lysyl-tRNA synthetase [Roseomonas mucosa]|uniref:Lysine--tRNA ligase n=1 Tax=Roseomonas mucosa TaxID=207340 RepID=A0A379N4F5_9PROT|nr:MULTISPECIES: lysine--tRNA ligase [Roseomonas]MBS5901523.1 lysine--tRNA ligase [Acetobacteraceae bacterium]MCG7353653.1 lysine--tRNA ligase [Roseomonas mucosa]MCG7357943.1 lysine--tRNA ligase [Roseomonas mucosa]MDT8288883.1 lysine--tRNA ligase [Roseomonas mucosa]MDT8293726.1 lysine--tRNA ligase [Roseomonas mucosa]